MRGADDCRASSQQSLLLEPGGADENYTTGFQQGTTERKSSMQKCFSSLLAVFAALATAAPLASYADSTNASAKVTLQSSWLNVVGPVSASTGGSGPITTDWQTVLEQNIKMANNHDL